MVSFSQIFLFFLIFSGISGSIFLEFLSSSLGYENRLLWKFRENPSKIGVPGRVLDFCSARNRDGTPKFRAYDLRDIDYLSGGKKNFEKIPISSGDNGNF